MKLESLLHGRLIKRYKRFFADVELENGEIITAHCPNTGSMKSLINKDWEIQSEAWVRHVDDPKRKLKYTLELLRTPKFPDKAPALACVNTQHPNKQVMEAIADGQIPEILSADDLERAELKAEVKYGKEKSRIDILLNLDASLTYVEVKNVTLVENQDHALFPDAVTTRGTKHLRELAEMVKEGHKAVIFYLVNRDDAVQFSPADHIDEEYGRTLREVMQTGVQVVIYQTEFSMHEVDGRWDIDMQLTKALPLAL